MHTSQIHQHVEKNSVLLKEVLTHRGERARGAFVDNIVLHSRDDADGARKCDAGECNIAGSGCAAGVFVILTLIIETQSSSRRLIDTSRKPIVWTLSLAFWQQKNFYGSGLVSDRRSPKRLFARVAAADSAVRIFIETMHRCTRAPQSRRRRSRRHRVNAPFRRPVWL